MAAASILLFICKMSDENAPRGPADRKMSSRTPGKTHHEQGPFKYLQSLDHEFAAELI